jgi:hypothetical protein
MSPENAIFYIAALEAFSSYDPDFNLEMYRAYICPKIYRMLIAYTEKKRCVADMLKSGYLAEFENSEAVETTDFSHLFDQPK